MLAYCRFFALDRRSRARRACAKISLFFSAARSRHSLLPAIALRSPAAWQVREEGEYYIPDVLGDEDYDADGDLE